MASSSRRVSPARVLLCAFFMGCAFALASWTSASADDTGLLSTVGEAVTSAGETVEDTTAAVSLAAPEPVAKPVDEVGATSVAKAVETVSAPVRETVSRPVVRVPETVSAPVEELVGKPVAVVDEAVASVVVTSSKVLSDSTVRVADEVKDLAPAIAPVVDSVIGLTAPARPVEVPVPVPAVDVVDEVLGTVGLGAEDASVTGVAESAQRLGSAETSRLAIPTLAGRQSSTMSDEPSAAALLNPPAPISTVSASPADGAGTAGGSPADAPGGRFVVPGGSSSAPGASGPASGGDAGLAPAWFEMPRFASLSIAGEQARPASGPCADPGSRPG